MTQGTYNIVVADAAPGKQCEIVVDHPPYGPHSRSRCTRPARYAVAWTDDGGRRHTECLCWQHGPRTWAAVRRYEKAKKAP